MRMHKECFDAHVQFRREKTKGQSRSCSVYRNFRTQQRITKGFKTIFNSTFFSNFFPFPCLKEIRASCCYFTVCKNKPLNREDVKV